MIPDGVALRPEPPVARSPIRLERVALFIAITAIGFAAARVVDKPVYDLVGNVATREVDLYRMFRVAGFLPAWLLVAAAFVMIDAGSFRMAALRAGMRRGVLLATAVIGAGAVGEILKILIRRERPDAFAGGYHFRAWSENTFSSSGLALPSSHALVAFGAAWMLCRLHPGAAPVWLLLAVGCATTRVLSQKHFVSDVFVSAAVSYAVVWLIWRLHANRVPRRTA